MIPGITASTPFVVRQPNGPDSWAPIPDAVVGVPSNMVFRTVGTNGTGTWVASGDVSGSGRRIASSVDDGVTWTVVNDPNNQYGINRIRFIDGAFWGNVYSQTFMYRSTTGVGGWSAVTVNTGITAYNYNMLDDPVNANWVWCIGWDGVRRTTTGMTGTWTNLTGSVFNMFMQDIATNGAGMYVVVGGSGSSAQTAPAKAIYSTNNGSGWSAPITITSGGGCYSITWDGTYWIAGCTNGIFVSTDAITWNQMKAGSIVQNVRYNSADGSRVAVGQTNTPLISRDSISTWLVTAIPGQSYIYYDMAFSDKLWMAAGSKLVMSPIARG